MPKLSLYDYQQDALAHLLAGKKILILEVGLGKTGVSMRYAEEMCKRTSKSKILVVTTASKTKARNENGDDDFTADARLFCSSSFCDSLTSSLSLISWNKLARWTDEHWSEIEEYIIIYDEIQFAKSGCASGRGKAFLKIAKKNQDWIGMTATPGDDWLSFYAYFTATNLVRNKTSFLAEYANVQTYKGYPEIVGWRNEAKLKDMWARISYAPDARKALQELPKSVNRAITFSLPKTYATVLKTRMRAGSDGSNYDEDFLDTAGALTSELRRVCFTKDKQEWVSDFVASLNTGAVMFYNFIATGDKLEELCSKALPDGARVWRIDGKHHDIPTATTIGPRDIVLCQWQSGSAALNLQFLNYEVLVELPYSYSTLRQGLGRIKRLGQTRTTFFYTLLCDKGIEQDVKEILYTKGQFSAKTWCLGKGIKIKGE